MVCGILFMTFDEHELVNVQPFIKSIRISARANTLVIGVFYS